MCRNYGALADLGQAGRVQKLCMCLGRARARLTHDARELSLSELRCGGFRCRREARARLVVCRNSACALVGLGSGCSCAEIMHVPGRVGQPTHAARELSLSELRCGGFRRRREARARLVVCRNYACALVGLGSGWAVQKLCMCWSSPSRAGRRARAELVRAAVRRLRRRAKLEPGWSCVEIMHVPWSDLAAVARVQKLCMCLASSVVIPAAREAELVRSWQEELPEARATTCAEIMHVPWSDLGQLCVQKLHVLGRALARLTHAARG